MRQDMVEHVGVAGRRERNKQRNRARIYEAAIASFVENGYDKTTIEDITARADVARGTFFNYFQRKEDLITAWADHRRALMIERLELPLSIDTTDAPTLLRLCVEVLAEVTEGQREEAETMLAAWMRTGRPLSEEPYTAAVFTEIIHAGQQRGEIDGGVDPELMGNVVRDLYLGALFRWIRNRGARESLGVELARIVTALLAGIATNMGAAHGSAR